MLISCLFFRGHLNCLRIIHYLFQDQYANSLMHDANMTFRVPLHRMVGATAVMMCAFWVEFEFIFVEDIVSDLA